MLQLEKALIPKPQQLVCHGKELLDHSFDMAAEYLAAAGFTSKWILSDNGFKEVAL